MKHTHGGPLSSLTDWSQLIINSPMPFNLWHPRWKHCRGTSCESLCGKDGSGSRYVPQVLPGKQTFVGWWLVLTRGAAQILRWPRLHSPAGMNNAGLRSQRQQRADAGGWKPPRQNPTFVLWLLLGSFLPVSLPLPQKKDRWHMFTLGKEGTQHASSPYAPVENTSHLDLVH